MSDMEMFDRICGDCAGVDMAGLTESNIREMAEIWGDVSEADIESAIRGLEEYQDMSGR